MKKRAGLRKFLSLLLLVGTLLGIFHHHNDLKPHPNCSVCVLKHNLAHGDLAAAVKLPAVDTLVETPLHDPVRRICAETPTLPPVRAPPIG